MTEQERQLTKRWVDTWKAAGPALEAVRDQDIRNSETWMAFELFNGLWDNAMKTHPPEPWSGLVEQQDWFRKMAQT